MVEMDESRRRMVLSTDARGRTEARGFADSYRLVVAFGGPRHWYVGLHARSPDGMRYEEHAPLRFVAFVTGPLDDAAGADGVVSQMAHGERANPLLQRWLDIDDRLYEHYLEEKAAGEVVEEGE